MPSGEDVTVPVPVPARVTDSGVVRRGVLLDPERVSGDGERAGARVGAAVAGDRVPDRAVATPGVPDVTVIQPSLLVAVQAQPAVAVTSTLPVPPRPGRQ